MKEQMRERVKDEEGEGVKRQLMRELKEANEEVIDKDDP